MAHTPTPPSDINAPNDLTETAAASPAIPNDLTETASAVPTIPNDLTETAAAVPAIPNDLTETAAASPAIPNDLTETAAAAPAIPNALTTAAPTALPRALVPRLDLNFAAQQQSVAGVPSALDDISTYSRTSSASYWGEYITPNGNREARIFENFSGSATNEVLYSEDFSQWTVTAASVGPSIHPDPLGGNFASLLVDDTSTATHQIEPVDTFTDNKTISIYVKPAGVPAVVLRLTGAGAGYVKFNLAAASIINITGADVVSGEAEHVGNGWVRCTIRATEPASYGLEIRMAMDLLPTDVTTYTGDGTSGVYLFGAQVTATEKPVPYIKTAGSSVLNTFAASPRYEIDPLTREPLGYLAEGGATNAATYSEQFDHADWAKAFLTVEPNSLRAPDGSISAWGMVPTADDDQHQMIQTFSFSDNQIISFSIYAKRGGYNFLRIAPTDNAGSAFTSYFDLGQGAVSIVGTGHTAKIQDVGGGWFRCSVSYNTGVGASANAVRFGVAEASGSSGFVGNNIGLIYMWGAQVATGLFPSSYIRTEASSVARASDQLIIQNAAEGNTQNESTALVEFDLIGKTAGNQYVYSYNPSGSATGILWWPAGGNKIGYFKEGLTQASGLFLDVGDTVKTVATYSNQVASMYQDGALIEENSDSFIAVGISEISVGADRIQGQHLFGHIKRLTIYDREMTAEEVALL